jgi:hypothetical protein
MGSHHMPLIVCCWSVPTTGSSRWATYLNTVMCRPVGSKRTCQNIVLPEKLAWLPPPAT